MLLGCESFRAVDNYGLIIGDLFFAFYALPHVLPRLHFIPSTLALRAAKASRNESSSSPSL